MSLEHAHRREGVGKTDRRYFTSVTTSQLSSVARRHREATNKKKQVIKIQSSNGE